jgi:hypothetical protein
MTIVAPPNLRYLLVALDIGTPYLELYLPALARVKVLEMQ